MSLLTLGAITVVMSYLLLHFEKPAESRRIDDTRREIRHRVAHLADLLDVDVTCSDFGDAGTQGWDFALDPATAACAHHLPADCPENRNYHKFRTYADLTTRGSGADDGTGEGAVLPSAKAVRSCQNVTLHTVYDDACLPPLVRGVLGDRLEVNRGTSHATKLPVAHVYLQFKEELERLFPFLERCWTDSGSQYFVATFIYTIGYGDVVPKTSESRIFLTYLAFPAIAATGIALSHLATIAFTLFRALNFRTKKETTLPALPKEGQSNKTMLENEVFHSLWHKLVTERLDEVDTRVWRGIMDAYDVSGDGKMNLDEARMVLEDMQRHGFFSLGIKQWLADTVNETIDKSRRVAAKISMGTLTAQPGQESDNGTEKQLNSTNFAQALSTKMRDSRIEKMVRVADRNGDGHVDIWEFRDIIKILGEHRACEIRVKGVARELYTVMTILILAIVLGAVGFAQLEGWSMNDSMYFSVISLSTVGLGDITPTSTTSLLFWHCWCAFALGNTALCISAFTALECAVSEERRAARRVSKLCREQRDGEEDGEEDDAE